MRKRISMAAAAALVFNLGSAVAADPVTETIQHSFTGADGSYPSYGAPTLGKDGNLYGVTEQGGAFQRGAICRVAPDDTQTLLYSFQGNGDGVNPSWTLARDAQGNFYGMSEQDNSDTHRGTVFKITPAGVFTTLHRFAWSGAAGWTWQNAITVGQDGYLYGVAFEGGSHGWARSFD